MSLPELKKGTTIYALLKEAGMELQDWPHANYPRQNMRWAWTALIHHGTTNKAATGGEV